VGEQRQADDRLPADAAFSDPVDLDLDGATQLPVLSGPPRLWPGVIGLSC